MNDKLTELERLMVAIQKAADEWLPAQLIADQLDNDQAPYLSSLQNTLARMPAGTKDAQQPSEAYLKRAAQGSDDYREFIKNMVLAKNKALTLKVRYENLCKWLDIKRTEEATERAKIEKGIFHGGK